MALEHGKDKDYDDGHHTPHFPEKKGGADVLRMTAEVGMLDFF